MLRLAWPRALRAVLAAVLILVMAVIVGYFISHRRPPTIVPSQTTEIPEKQVEKQEGIEHIDFRGERTIHVKAGSWRKGEDGLFYLEKDVEVRDLAKKGGREVDISGDRVIYDKDWTRARLEGKAVVRYGELQFASTDFDYRKDQDVVSTEHGVVIASPKLNGSAERLTYVFKDEIIRLEGAASLQGRQEGEGAEPFTISANVLIYRRLERRGRAEGDVVFTLGESRGAAGAVDFRMTDDEQYLLDFSLQDGARVRQAASAPAGDSQQPALGRDQELQAPEISGRAFLNMNKIHAVEARGGSTLDSFASEGQPVRVRSAEMLLVFDRWGGLREFRAASGAELVEREPGGRVARTLTGAGIVVEGPGDMLRVAAPAGGEARLDSDEIEITGQEIDLVPRTEDLYASGSVKLLLKPRTAGRDSVGFFSGTEPVLAVAGSLSYEKALDRLVLSEGARMWQGKQVLSGQEISARRDTGELQGTGKVQAVFPRPSKKDGGKEERLEVGGAGLGFNPRDHLLKFQKDCWLRMQSASLTADRVDVVLGEGDAIRTIEANGRVVITSGLREGRGNTAVYDPDKETIDLTGNPSLTDKEKGVIEGDRLTFNLGDGRIHVENKARERSVTVIKS